MTTETDNNQNHSNNKGYELSPQQTRLLTVANHFPVLDGAFNTLLAVTVNGSIDIAALGRALNDVVSDFEILRTRYKRPTGFRFPLQLIDDANEESDDGSSPEVQVQVVDLSQSETLIAATSEATRLQHKLRATAFDLEQDIPLRASCVLLPENQTQLVLVAPAIALDRDGMWQLFQHVQTACSGSGTGISSEESNSQDDEAELLQYVDVSGWLSELTSAEDYPDEADFWQRQTAQLDVKYTMPLYLSTHWSTNRDTDHSADYSTGVVSENLPGAASAQASTSKMAEQLVWINAEQHPALFSLIQQHGIASGSASRFASSEALFATAWLALLAQYTGSEDVNMAVYGNGRADEELADLVGLLGKYMPVSLNAAPDQVAQAVSFEIEKRITAAKEQQDYYAWQGLNQHSGEANNAGESRLQLQYGFDFQHITAQVNWAGNLCRVQQLQHRIEQFELALSVSLFVGDQQSEAGQNQSNISQIALNFSYLPTKLDATSVQFIQQRYLTLLHDLLTSEAASIGELDGVSEQEKAIIAATNAVTRDDEQAQLQCAHEQIQYWAERYPQRIAVATENNSLTYQALQQQSTALAAQICQVSESGDVSAFNGKTIAVCLGRNTQLITAMVAVFQVGGIYVPIDPENHPKRIEYVLKDAQCELLITDSMHHDKLANSALQEFSGAILNLDKCAFREPFPLADFVPVSLQNPAYLIYTSGSTGNPKGVAVSHLALANYVMGVDARLNLSDEASLLFLSSIGTDLGHTALFGALLTGRALRILDQDKTMDAAALAAHLSDNPVACLKIVPSHLQALLSLDNPAQILPTECLVLGGEKAIPELVHKVRQIKPSLRILNHYGPTETTVGIMVDEIPLDLPQSTSVFPIGTPLANSACHILNSHHQPVGVGVIGELYFSGKSLANGYWQRPELTAERFVTGITSENERLYHTGDLACYQPDGRVVFVGRSDHQVKIRGHRVELGEIEACIRQLDAVKEVVVLLSESSSSSSSNSAPGSASELTHAQLAAYIVCREDQNTGSQPIEVSDIQGYVSQHLPDYMVPAACCFLDKLPLNRSGKIDRNALPDISEFEQQSRDDFLAPRNEIETLLVDIWRELLGKNDIGVLHSFFALGGDSITSIQLAARLRSHGYQLSPKDVFELTTIENIAEALKALDENKTANPAEQFEQGSVTGELPLTPIQQRYFELYDNPAVAHYNQSILFNVSQATDSGSVSAAQLKTALEALCHHHDMLRCRFQPSPDTHEASQSDIHWKQHILPAAPEIVVREFAIDNSGKDNCKNNSDTHTSTHTSINSAIEQVQQSLNLETGQLLGAALLHIQNEHTDKPSTQFFLTIHHLVVDAVSWQILIEDLNVALQQIVSGEASVSDESAQNNQQKPTIRFTSKTLSFKKWAQLLADYAQSEPLQQELMYWQGQRSTNSLPLETGAANTQYQRVAADFTELSFSLDASTTDRLLTLVPQRFNSDIKDTLLAGIGQAFYGWTQQHDVVIELEGHGRVSLEEQLNDDAPGETSIDTSRTVGWFTSRFPVRVPCFNPGKLGEQIIAAKEAMHAVPNEGIGYGLLKYLGSNSARQSLGYEAEISFNYLGQQQSSSANKAQQALLQVIPSEPVGNIHPSHPRPHKLYISGFVADGKLVMKLAFSEKEYTAAHMQKLANAYQEGLQAIADYCRNDNVARYSVSDFADLTCTQQDFEQITAAHPLPFGEIEDIYPLSPLQEGLLFESKFRSGVGVNIIYMEASIRGDLNMTLWKQCWDNMVARYGIFRTAFIGWEQGLPVQVVYKPQINNKHEKADSQLPWAFFDLSDKDQQAQQTWLAELHEEQRKLDFDQASAPLMRVIMAKLGEQSYKLIWQRHHAIADGWSSSKVVRDLLMEYEYLAAGATPPEQPIVPYQHYIDWLQNKQKSQPAHAYWQQYLQGVNRQTPVCVDEAWHKSLDENKTEEVVIGLPVELKTQIIEFAKQQDLTVGFVFQLTWAFLLAIYSGQKDVVYGAVVSGRPADLEGVDDIVGPLINTLPVRFNFTQLEQALGESSFDFSAWLNAQKRGFVETNEYSFTPLMDIQKQVNQQRKDTTGGNDNDGLSSPLFSSVFLVQNFVTDAQRDQIQQDKARSSIELDMPGASYKTSYPISTFVTLGDDYQIRFVYESSKISQQQAHAFGTTMQHILTTLIQGDVQQILSLGMPCATLVQQRAEQAKQRAHFDQVLAGLHTPVRVFSLLGRKQHTQSDSQDKAGRIAVTRVVNKADFATLFSADSALNADSKTSLPNESIFVEAQAQHDREQTVLATAFGMVVSQCSGMGDVAIGLGASGLGARGVRTGADNLSQEKSGSCLPVRLNMQNASAQQTLSAVAEQLAGLTRIAEGGFGSAGQQVLEKACRNNKDNEWLFDSLLLIEQAADAKTDKTKKQQSTTHLLNRIPDAMNWSLLLNVVMGESTMELQLFSNVIFAKSDASENHGEDEPARLAEQVLDYFESALLLLQSRLLQKSSLQKSALQKQPLAWQSVVNPDAIEALVAAANTYSQQDLSQSEPETETKSEQASLIHPYIERAAEQYANKIAIICGEQRLTYAQLNHQANQLSHYLRNQCNVLPDTLVGIQIPRSSVNVVVAIVAVLKAGGGYVPIDPEYPPARIRYITDDANIATVITLDWLQDITRANHIAAQPAHNIAAEQSQLYPEHIAYSIYTSGSTGKPKGVLVAHNSAVNLYQWYGESLLKDSLPNQDDTVTGANLVLSSLSFDLTQKNVLSTLMFGHTIMLPAVSGFEPEAILQCFEQHPVTVVNCAPSMFYALAEHASELSAHTPFTAHKPFDALRAVVLGGESIDALIMNRFLQAYPNCRLVNSYGPTECTDVTTYHLVPAFAESKQALTSDIPIGKGILNTTHYVLDDNLRLCPDNVVGELYLGGEAVSRGYKDRPALTAERFIPNPFLTDSPTERHLQKNRPQDSMRLYQTGDLVCRQSDGTIKFLGRRDHQVKIRGLRIEIGEIEAEIRNVSCIRNGAVMVHTFPNGKENLVAYLSFDEQVPDEQQAQLIEQVRFALGDNLPEYMLPQLFIPMAHIPLSPNGKIDRTALPEPDYSDIQSEYVPPRTQVERQLCEWWSGLLDVEKVSIDDNFYHLGGHSLLLVQFVAKASRNKIELLADDVINAPTIRELAIIAGKRNQQLAPANKTTSYSSDEQIYSLPNKQTLFIAHKQNLWNITRIVNVANANTRLLENAVMQLVDTHDTLRHYFVQENGRVVEKRKPKGELQPFTYVDLSQIDKADLSDEIERRANEFQQSINLASNLVRFVLFDCGVNANGEPEPARFLVIVHHALIDAFGIDPLMHEVIARYLSGLNNWPYEPHTGSSINEFAQALHHYANSDASDAELSYWQEQSFSKVRSLVEFDDGFAKNSSDDDSHYGEAVVCKMELDDSRSARLLSDGLLDQGMTISDVLLCAWTDTLATLSSSEHVQFEMLSNGRAKIFPGIDVSTSVGWFLTLYPMLHKVDLSAKPAERVKHFNQALKAIPKGGNGFEALKYLSQDEQVQQAMKALPQPDFRLNVLTPKMSVDLDQAEQSQSAGAASGGAVTARDVFTRATESPGQTIAYGKMRVEAPAYVRIYAVRGNVEVRIASRDNIFSQGRIDTITKLYLKNLAHLLDALYE